MVESSRVRARATADVLFAAQMRFGVRPAPPARQDSAASYYEPLLRDDLGASPPDEGEDAGSMCEWPAACSCALLLLQNLLLLLLLLLV